MIGSLPADGSATAQYVFRVGDDQLSLNELLGERLSIHYTGQIHCTNCGRKTKKSFSQGHCFPCMRKLASCDMCILKPELCHYDQGTCREPEWGLQWCMDTHYVYIANTSALKVGITRHSNIPSRWIDQGAVQALPVYKVASRRISGLLETLIASSMQDKTNWRAMLKGEPQSVDLADRVDAINAALVDPLAQLRDEFGEDAIARVEPREVCRISYPVQAYPEKIVSFNLDRTPHIDAQLMGIKGQYLIFDSGVINVRKFTGYEVEVSV